MSLNTDIKKILLIFPPSTSLASWEPMVTTPMGIAYLGSTLREKGYEVELWDTVLEAPYQETRITDHISRFGLTFDQIMEGVKKSRPDMVGLSCIFSNQWPSVRELSKRIKAMDPDMPVICGGAHPSFLSGPCMDDAPLDFILKGESEHSFVDFLEKFRNGKSVAEVDGLVYRDGEEIRENPKTAFIQDLDSLPFPAHDLLPTEKYFETALPMSYWFSNPRNIPIITSRGCPCRCTFCSSTHLWGTHHRTRSAENVLKEIDWLVDKWGVGELKFQDDNLTVNKKRAEQIFSGMVERDYNLEWTTPNGIAIWTLDGPLLKLMKQSGCWSLTFAVESGDQEILTGLIKKPLKLDKAREVNDIARDLGIHRAGYFIVGFPGETKEQIMKTVHFARELDLQSWILFIYNPLPGSQLFQECVDRGYITEESFFETGNLYFSSVIDSEDWTSEELEALIRREYLRHYFKIFKYPRLVGKVWYGYFRYRPSFMKYFALRTYRAMQLSWKEAFSNSGLAFLEKR